MKPRPFRYWLALSVLAIGFVMVAGYGLRAYRHIGSFKVIESRPPTVEGIRGWMTVDYLARLYGINETAIFDALGVPPGTDPKLSLRELTEQQQLDPNRVRAALRALVHNRALFEFNLGPST